MTIVDAILVLVVASAAIGGWRLGLTGFLPGVIGVVLGVAAASAPAGAVMPAEPGALRLGAMIVVLAVGGVLGAGIGHRVGAIAGRALTAAALRPVDRAVGAAARAGAALVVCWVVVGILGALVPRTVAYTGSSVVLDGVQRVLPDRNTVVADATRVLRLPADVVALIPGSAAIPLDPAVVGSTAAAASRSVVKILGTGCGSGVEGSGFAVEDGSGGVVVVTNAHVVTGTDRLAVQDTGGVHPARVVAFDDATDLALLRVAGLTAPTLDLAADAAPNGTGGVVLGYPGDGRLTAGAATVVQRIPMVQPGVAGGVEAREVYRLAARVREGNSGGPLVGTDGTVLGVVNARSLVDPDVGFALTLPPLRNALDVVADSVDPVATGACGVR